MQIHNKTKYSKLNIWEKINKRVKNTISGLWDNFIESIIYINNISEEEGGIEVNGKIISEHFQNMMKTINA